MADQVITVSEPAVGGTNGLSIRFTRVAGAWRCDIIYLSNGVEYATSRSLVNADFTAAQRQDIAEALAAAIAVGKPLMIRTDGGPSPGWT